MKRIFTLLSLLPLAPAAFGQITINATDMPVPTAAYHIRNITSSAATNPTVGTSATWDYGAYAGTADSNVYIPETDTFFTVAGVDVYKLDFKSLKYGLGYYIYSEIDFNSSNVKESGIDVLYQAYGLPSAATDSLYIPAQHYILPAAKEIIHFPFTANSTWSSSTRRSITLELTVGAASLSHAAVQHVYYVNRKDTVVGWGKMRVYATSGPSIQYDVLMDKISQYAVDSFYMGGAPANPILLAGFGLSQGQKTDTIYRYNFYRKTSFNYLLAFSYGSDGSYTTPVGKFTHSDNITPAGVGVDELGAGTYSTVLFPNPANGSEVNLLVNGKDVTGGQYFVTDIAGKVVQSGTIEMSKGAVHVALNSSLVNGNYFLNVTDATNAKIATEQFTIAK